MNMKENNLMTDEELEKKMQSRPGETVTKEYMESRIKDVSYHRLPASTVTICSIELDNGFSVRGESACVDPTNFDEEMGRKIAYDKTFPKLWDMFGFLLSEKRYFRSKVDPMGRNDGGIDDADEDEEERTS